MAVSAPFAIREHRIGDLGWVIASHAKLYSDEYGWDHTFESFVARIAADFIDSYDPDQSCCLIAEVDGQNMGSAMVVPQAPDVAKLRLVIVDPKAQGMGIGQSLVSRCIEFAREKQYQEMVLWTNDILVQARRIYQAQGFEWVRDEPHHSFGQQLVGQYWRKSLR